MFVDTICKKQEIDEKIINIVIKSKQKEIQKLSNDKTSEILRKADIHNSDLEEYLFESAIAEFIFECLSQKADVKMKAFYDLEFLHRIGYQLLRALHSYFNSKEFESYFTYTFKTAMKYRFIREVFSLIYSAEEMELLYKLDEELVEESTTNP